MKIIGHFTESDKLKNELKNQNVLSTNTPGLFHCAVTGMRFNQEVLNKMEAMGTFIYDNIETASISASAIKKKPGKTNWKKIRITLMAAGVIILILVNIGILLFFNP